MAVQTINNLQMPTAGPRQATVELSSANLLALRATPIQVIAAPGAGKFIVIEKAVIFYHPGGAQYNVAGGGDIELLLGSNQPFATACSTNENILTQASECVGNFIVYNAADYDTLSNMENLALNVKNVGGGEYTTGTGTATLVVQYSVMDKT